MIEIFILVIMKDSNIVKLGKTYEIIKIIKEIKNVY